MDVEAVIARYSQEVDERATIETAQKFLNGVNAEGQKLIRQTDGKLGATINDPDIYRVGENGVPTFYNPDTGKPFTGDNPRQQAKQWVEEYNEELRDTFNKYAEERAQELQNEITPVVNLLKFAPTYDSLDPVRQRMLDAILEDYEVHDAQGAHIGYSVDLDRALAQVNKQIKMIQSTRPAPAPTGPALDMPNSGNESVNRADIKSLADAMEATQDAQLAKLKPRK